MKASHPLRLGLRLPLLASLLLSPALFAQTLYKYPAPDGGWVYADRPPADAEVSEVRQLAPVGIRQRVEVTSRSDGAALHFEARNHLHAPVELELRFTEIVGLEYPHPDRRLRWVLPPNSDMRLFELVQLRDGSVPAARYVYNFRIGDPAAQHRPDAPYRAPFAVASRYPVTQAWPDNVTHDSDDSRHAIDFAMPVGTPVYAARGGIVFDVSADNYRSGLDRERDGPAANVVQVLHDDGTYALYAHLNWNSIRVRPGDRVVRGQYIADSGNTGFSSGPHLHFAVLKNTGMKTMSLPVIFRGAGEGSALAPATGASIAAY